MTTIDRRSLSPYPRPPEQAQPRVSTPCRATEDRSWDQLRAPHQFAPAHHGFARTLRLNNFYGADAACNAHPLGEEGSGYSGVQDHLGAEKLNTFRLSSD